MYLYLSNDEWGHSVLTKNQETQFHPQTLIFQIPLDKQSQEYIKFPERHWKRAVFPKQRDSAI